MILSGPSPIRVSLNIAVKRIHIIAPRELVVVAQFRSLHHNHFILHAIVNAIFHCMATVARANVTGATADQASLSSDAVRGIVNGGSDQHNGAKYGKELRRG